MKKDEIINSIKIITLALVVGLGVNYVSATWTNPPATPPNDNVAAPLNAGGAGQVKVGGLVLGTGVNMNVLPGDPTNPAVAGSYGLTAFGNILFPKDAGAGKVLTSDAYGNATWGNAAASGSVPSSIVVLTSSASCPWLVPANVSKIRVRGWGAGASGYVQFNQPSSGGGGGAYFEEILSVAPGTPSIACSIGVSSGGNTTFGTATARGGDGGLGGTASGASFMVAGHNAIGNISGGAGAFGGSGGILAQQSGGTPGGGGFQNGGGGAGRIIIEY